MTEDQLLLTMRELSEEHEKRLCEYLNERLSHLEETIKSAYPEGDPHKHRAIHEAQIKQQEMWDKVKTEFLSKVLTGGLYGLGVFILSLIWDYITKVRK